MVGHPAAIPEMEIETLPETETVVDPGFLEGGGEWPKATRGGASWPSAVLLPRKNLKVRPNS